MWLPTPKPEDVEEFRALILKEFGLELSPDEALDASTRLLQIHFILKYAYRPLRSKID